MGCNLYHRFGSAFIPVKVFNVSAVLVFLASVPLGYTRILGLVYAAYWVLQICSGFFWPPVMAWLTSGLNRQELNREIGLYNRSWMAGSIIGPLVSGFLYQWKSGLDFFVLSLSFFLVKPFLYLMRRSFQAGNYGVADVPRDALPPRDALQEIVEASKTSDKRLDLYRYRGWVSGLSSMIFVGVLVNILPLHIRDGLGLTERSAGVMLFVRCVMSFVGFSILARFVNWHFNQKWFVFLQYGLMLCTVLLMFAGNKFFIYVVVVLLYGLMYSAGYNNSMFYSGATGGNPKKNLALHEIFLCIGNASGTMLGGFFYQYFRLTGTCIALFLALGVGLGILVFLGRRDARLSVELGHINDET